VCCVWLSVSVFLQACGVLWFLNILCEVCFGVLCICIDDYMRELYIPDLKRAGVDIIKQVSPSWSTFIQISR